MFVSSFLMLLLPPLLYGGIIYLTSPYKSISVTTSLKYIFAGMLSIFFLVGLNIFFPYQYTATNDPFKSFFYEIAVHEELAKLIMFLIFGSFIKSSNKHPIGTMFYMGMVGLGFAMLENLDYYVIYGSNVLPIRNATSTIAHMLFGMFTGYWISLSKVKITKYGNRSVFDILMAKYQTLRTIVHYGIGLMCGIAYHGLWNYNLMTSKDSAYPIMILMIFIGLIGVKFAATTLQHKREETNE